MALSPSEHNYFYQFRVIIIGDSTVGKSSLLRQFTEGHFIQTNDPTVGVDFHVRIIELGDTGVRVKLQLWDTAGQERFRSITRSYYRNCVGCIILYDITSRESFEHVHDWLQEARNSTEDDNVVYLLLGHKIDLEYKREVSTAEGESFALAHDMLFIETSAKVVCNIEESFVMVAKEIYSRLQGGKIRQRPGWDGVKAVPSSSARLAQRTAESTVNESNESESPKSCCGF